jgi:hypothetical protein
MVFGHKMYVFPGKIEVSMDTLMVSARKMKVISGKKLFE